MALRHFRRLLLGLLSTALCLLIPHEVSQGALPAQVRVHLFETQPYLHQLLITGPFRLKAPVQQQFPAGNYRLTVMQNQVVLSKVGSPLLPLCKASRIRLQAFNSQNLRAGTEGQVFRYYRGDLHVTVNTPHPTLSVENLVSSPDYVAGVVASETPPQWPLEALKAQAVLTQTRLARYHPNNPLGDSTQQESYRGDPQNRPEVRQAVSTVWGQVLTFHQQPIEAFYHAACGGRTQAAKGYFAPKDPGKPYLSSVVCPYCKASPFWKTHEALLPRTRFEAVFGPGIPKVIQQDTTQRPLWLQWPNRQKMSGYAFWLKLGQHFGWDKAPGSRYQILATPEGAYIKIRSTGAGHGIGLCQWGAAGLARMGKSYREILQYYFPNAQLN